MENLNPRRYGIRFSSAKDHSGHGRKDKVGVGQRRREGVRVPAGIRGLSVGEV